MGSVIPPLEVVQRLRPVDLVAPGDRLESDGAGWHPLPRPAPYAAAAVTLSHRDDYDDRDDGDGDGDGATLALESGSDRLEVRLADGTLSLAVTTGGAKDGQTGGQTDWHRSRHRSRRHGRVRAPDAVGISLTGTHLSAWSREDGDWVVRGRVDLEERIDTHDEEWLARLALVVDGPVGHVEAGGFGQLGLRDLRFVTTAAGRPVEDDGALWLSATSAGPGFFDTGHTSVWRLDPRRDPVHLEHTGDVYFRRPDRAGVYGDHATHVIRDGEEWLVATSTWGDFDADDPERHVRAVLARTDADLLHGEHVLDTAPLALPTDGLASVGVWDPHLVRTAEGWVAAYVSASRYFRFHPCLATGPALDALALRAADTRRTATEGVTLLDLDGAWRLLASDGPGGRRGQRERMPVLDLDLREVGVLEAPYPTNLPWPTLARRDGGWLMVTFDGTPAGGPLTGYGTHGDVVVMREARD